MISQWHVYSYCEIGKWNWRRISTSVFNMRQSKDPKHAHNHMMAFIVAFFNNTAAATDRKTTEHMMTPSNGNFFRVTGPLCGEFTGHRGPVTRSFVVFFDLHLNKQLSKQWWGWWSETHSRSLWRHCYWAFLTSNSSHWSQNHTAFM